MDRRDLVVNGITYSIMVPNPLAALPICTRTAVLVGAFAGLLADIKTLADPNASADEKKKRVLEKLTEALQNVDPVKTQQLLLDAATASRLSVGTETICTGVSFDQHFAQRRADVFPVLVWCLQECVTDFFPQVGTFTQALRGNRNAGEASQSPRDGGTTTG